MCEFAAHSQRFLEQTGPRLARDGTQAATLNWQGGAETGRPGQLGRSEPNATEATGGGPDARNEIANGSKWRDIGSAPFPGAGRRGSAPQSIGTGLALES